MPRQIGDKWIFAGLKISNALFMCHDSVIERKEVMPMSEKLLQEIRDELRKSNSTLSKILKGIEEYVKKKKKQST